MVYYSTALQNVPFCDMIHAKFEWKLQTVSQIWNCHSEWITFKESKTWNWTHSCWMARNKIFYTTSHSCRGHSNDDKAFSNPQSLLSFITTFLSLLEFHTTLHPFQPRRTFCILCAATLASSSESDSLWEVELWEAELQGEEHSGEHK